MRIALLQMTAGVEPDANADTLVAAIHEAARAGAAMLFTPEMSGLLDADGGRAASKVVTEAEDQVLARVRAAAGDAGIWVQLGSLALRAEGRPLWLNRSFVINSLGDIVARYDKMHLFDVDLSTGESWRESARYVSGARTTVTATPLGNLGLSICYDMRFPALYQALSGAGAQAIAIPAAFTVPTGRAHWHTLLRARAIENACFVIAAAQVGRHADGRATFGHSLVVDPWGTIVLDMADRPGVGYCEVDLAMVEDVRARIPVLIHRRDVPQPEVVE